MFKNLTRLRLLDFFELTAAIAGALYVYQSGGWWDFEKTWVIGALAISAIVIWVATRIGETTPTPGLFLAAYAGALYGLSGLSPWMSLLGRLELIDFLLRVFPIQETSSISLPVARPAWIIVLLTAAIMITPAWLAGSFWKSSAIILQYFRGNNRHESKPLTKLLNGAQVTFAILAIVIIGFLWARPQIRHVKTIRIPFQYVKHDPTRLDTKLETAPSIVVWSLTERGDRLLILRSDKSTLEVDADSGAVLSNASLACKDFPIGPRSRVINNHESELVEVTIEDGPALQLDPTCHIVRTREGHILLWRDNIPAIYDGKTGAELLDHRLNALKNSKLKAISNNGVFALLGDDPEQETPEVTFGVWNLYTLEKIRRETFSRQAFEFHDFLVNDDGDKVRFCPSQFEIPCNRRSDWRFIEVIGDCRTGSAPQVSNDGKTTLAGMVLTSNSYESNKLYSFNNRRMHAKLAPSGSAIVLVAEPIQPANPEWEVIFKNLFAEMRVPIFDRLLERAHCGQLTLFNPKTNRSTTTFLPQGLLKHPDPTSAKFTEDGRHFIIQDEDNSADLFHIFSMP